jgi:hypothetical protein
MKNYRVQVETYDGCVTKLPEIVTIPSGALAV